MREHRIEHERGGKQAVELRGRGRSSLADSFNSQRSSRNIIRLRRWLPPRCSITPLIFGVTPMNRFARRVFTGAGIYGLIVLVPQYFLAARIGADTPPPITHQEYFYGFIGVAVAWQFVFLLIGRDPERYRPLMIPAVLEKLAFGVPAIILYTQGRLPGAVLPFG